MPYPLNATSAIFGLESLNILSCATFERSQALALKLQVTSAKRNGTYMDRSSSLASNCSVSSFHSRRYEHVRYRTVGAQKWPAMLD